MRAWESAMTVKFDLKDYVTYVNGTYRINGILIDENEDVYYNLCGLFCFGTVIHECVPQGKLKLSAPAPTSP